ncbi:MAG: hypothetical protein ACOYUZ_04630 [Patescibacteria group bacterium]
MIVDSREPSIYRSLQNVVAISIRPLNNGKSLEIRFKAYKLFAPAAMEVIALDLEVCFNGRTRIIAGVLRAIVQSSPRGLWYSYEFLPDIPGDLGLIAFQGCNLDSNIKKISTDSVKPKWSMENLFFKPL